MGHQCKRQLLLLEGGEIEEDVEEETVVVVNELDEEDNRVISRHAIKGIASIKIIKVDRRVQDSTLMVFGNGSTHNFIDEGTTKKLSCQLSNTQPLLVTIANDSKMMSKSACLGFCWTMQGETFEAGLRLLKLRGCQIILGVNWMKRVSSINFNFNKMEVTLAKEGKRVTLQGNVESGTCKMIKGKRLKKLLKYKLTQVARLFSIEAKKELEE